METEDIPKIHYRVFFPLHYTIFCIRIDFRQYLESEETGGMKIIKRNGSEEVFDINKIIKAVKRQI